MKAEYKLTNVRLDPQTLRALKQRALDEERPASSLVREAVGLYLALPQSTVSSEDWLRGFIGLAGDNPRVPSDLAENHDKYLYPSEKKKARRRT